MGNYSLEPIDHDPFEHEPVDHDPFASGPIMRAYQPTMRDKIGAFLMGGDKASPERRRLVEGLIGSTGLGNTGMSVSDLTPVGSVLGAQEAAQHGDYKGAAINAMFLGPAARTADHVALAAAQRMAESGAPRAAIHAETGWFQGADGKWRFEIDDRKTRLTPEFRTDAGGEPINMDDAFLHPKLFEAYPDMATMGAKHQTFKPELSRAYGGYNEAKDTVVLNNAHEVYKSQKESRSAMLHELQHAVQKREGFSAGENAHNLINEMPAAQAINDAQILSALRERGSEFPALDFLNTLGRDPHPVGRTLADEYSRNQLMQLPSNARDAYRRNAGEVEARNVQARKDFTPQQRKLIPPWETQDVPDQMQILTGWLPRF